MCVNRDMQELTQAQLRQRRDATMLYQHECNTHCRDMAQQFMGANTVRHPNHRQDCHEREQRHHAAATAAAGLAQM
jgi:hypothetical protein